MSDRFSQSSQDKPANGKNPLISRRAAILVMLLGLAGFVVSLSIFKDNDLYLFVSTLVVFLGLAGLIYARRTTGSAASAVTASDIRSSSGRTSSGRSISGRSSVPSGLRAAARAQTQEAISKPPAPTPPAVPEFEELAGRKGDLLDQVMDILEAQGAAVEIENQHEDRSILRIVTQSKKVYTAMVLESSEPVDVADVRALYALVTSSSSERGYLIVDGAFTPRAYEWAGARQIRLVSADELDELGI